MGQCVSLLRLCALPAVRGEVGLEIFSSHPGHLFIPRFVKDYHLPLDKEYNFRIE
jgi:hypothetical protein